VADFERDWGDERLDLVEQTARDICEACDQAMEVCAGGETYGVSARDLSARLALIRACLEMKHRARAAVQTFMDGPDSLTRAFELAEDLAETAMARIGSHLLTRPGRPGEDARHEGAGSDTGSDTWTR
jgi:hypothetical protein